MKKIALLVLIAAALGCCFLPKGRRAAAPSIAGRWSGEARFLDRDLAAEYGVFPVALEIAADDSVTGSVGAAELIDGEATGRDEDFVIEGRLKGAVFASGSLPKQGKDLVVLVLSPPAGDALEGNLHLKSNGVFDFTMRVCAVKLARRP